MTAEMKAVLVRQVGGPDALEYVDLPRPNPGPLHSDDQLNTGPSRRSSEASGDAIESSFGPLHSIPVGIKASAFVNGAD